MATLDELRLQQLLRPLEGPDGIASLNPLAFQYQNPQYPNSTQMFYQPRMDVSPTQDFYQPRMCFMWFLFAHKYPLHHNGSFF